MSYIFYDVMTDQFEAVANIVTEVPLQVGEELTLVIDDKEEPYRDRPMNSTVKRPGLYRVVGLRRSVTDLRKGPAAATRPNTDGQDHVAIVEPLEHD